MGVKDPGIPRSPQTVGNKDLDSYLQSDSRAFRDMLNDLKMQINWPTCSGQPTEVPKRIPMVKMDTTNDCLWIYFDDSWKKFESGSLTAAQILALLLTVDGSGSGLDADLLDGYHAQVAAGGNTIVQRHSSGYVYANYYNASCSPEDYAISHIPYIYNSDGFIRKLTPANFNKRTEFTVKGWVSINMTTAAIKDSYNVTSITDNGVGDFTVTWATDFINANYTIGAWGYSSTYAVVVQGKVGTGLPATGTVRIACTQNGASNLYYRDGDHVSIMAIGDQV